MHSILTMRESSFFSGGLNDVLLRSPEDCMVIAEGLGPRCTTQVDLPVQLGWHYQQQVWNRRISNKECRMLKGDTGLLPQEDAKRHESQWKREHSLSRRQLETYPDIAARFLQYSKFLARYSSVPAAGRASQIKDALDLCSTTRPPAPAYDHGALRAPKQYPVA